jgi:hypothetical protein
VFALWGRQELALVPFVTTVSIFGHEQIIRINSLSAHKPIWISEQINWNLNGLTTTINTRSIKKFLVLNRNVHHSAEIQGVHFAGLLDVQNTGISRQTEGHSFGDHLSSESVSVMPLSVIEASIVLCSVCLWLVWVDVESACALNTLYKNYLF